VVVNYSINNPRATNSPFEASPLDRAARRSGFRYVQETATVPKPWVKDWMLAVLTLALGDTLPTRQPSQAMSPRLGSVKAAPMSSPPLPG
jgi:hypothetical protein